MSVEVGYMCDMRSEGHLDLRFLLLQSLPRGSGGYRAELLQAPPDNHQYIQSFRCRQEAHHFMAFTHRLRQPIGILEHEQHVTRTPLEVRGRGASGVEAVPLSNDVRQQTPDNWEEATQLPLCFLSGHGQSGDGKIGIAALQ